MLAHWAALVGDRESGREQACGRLAEELATRDLRLGGVRQEAVFEDGAHVGYDAIDLASGTRMALARQSSTPRLCKWAFDSDVFEQARRSATEGEPDVVAFDVASLEASGEGHWPAITDALAAGRLVLLVLRPRVLGRVAMRLPDPVCGIELPTSESAIDEFVQEVAAQAHALRKAEPSRP